ncbi:type II secretion system F family protein [Telmatospirillum siberiense]|uniref:Type II secretion system F family protein n=1 Tax=Telmatospirillum siberiense TaxID=382514 RepID=A0A2N3Q1I9_9PROT|nr:type II secretion system F family protein [Telmatospirillum siberiense]PKU26517.1 type II secretion system F family protein [Telmatospirillum siberiense]
MPLYHYRALNQTGRRVSGQLNANNEADLYQRLKQINLELLTVSADKGRNRLALFGGRVKNRELIQMCLHLQQLSAAGVSLMEALADVRDATDHRRLRDLLAEVFEDVSSGQSLSEAFGRHPRVFSTVFQSLVAAGEESGNLTESFTQLIAHLKWSENLNAKIGRATRYPMIMLAVMAALFMFMMLFVVPQVVSFLMANGQELPIITMALIATSDFVQGYWWAITGLPVGGYFLFKLWARLSESFAYKIDFYILRVPLLGELRRKLSLSRFAHFFATMFQSGVPILTCLDTAGRVTGNRCLARSLALVRVGVEDGNPLSVGLRNTGEFPSLVIRLVKIGEDSGNLGETLNNVTDFYDRDVERSVDALVSMIEPALTLFAGAMMAWIVLAVLGPIYDSLSRMG